MGKLGYGKVHHVGHRDIRELLYDDVVVEEKVDGSQFNFGVVDGKLFCCSRNQDLNVEDPDSNAMFAGAVRTVLQAVQSTADLPDGYVYSGEVLARPRHNVLQYDRVPKGHIALFEVRAPDGNRVTLPAVKQMIAEGFNIEAVPTLFEGRIESEAQLAQFFERESFLGGCKIEGVVVKNYKRGLIGKLVSDGFREIKGLKPKKNKNQADDIVRALAESYSHPARWRKVVQHLRDDGKLKGDNSDIGLCIRELQSDIEEECAEDAKEKLWAWARKKLLGTSARGFPEWYQMLLSQGDA